MSAFAVAASAAAICACSVVIGAAVWRAAGFRGWSWLAAPTGLAALIAICLAAVQLPHGRIVAPIAVAAALVASIALRPRGRLRGEVGETALVMVVGALVASLPFIAAGRAGILGITDNADLSAHLLLADSVGSGHAPIGLDPTWYKSYPTGPHALVATLHAAFGIPIDAAFMGLLVATLAISATCALLLLREVTLTRRVVGAVIAGIPFLAAFYTVQASFKETLLGVFVVAWALSLPVVLGASRRRGLAIIPLGVLAAGAYGDYNFVALAWLGAVAIPYVVYVLARDGGVARIQLSRRAAIGAAVFLVIVAVIALPMAGQTKALVGAVKATAGGQTSGGNITAQLAAYQIFGVWPSHDGRSFGLSLDLMRLLGVVGAAFAIWAVVWWWRRRRVELISAVLGTVAIYLVVRGRATPYYTGKALVIAAFPVALMTVSAVMLALPRFRGLGAQPPLRKAGALAGVAFLALAAWSSGLALRAGRVQPDAHRSELVSLRPLLATGPTLYLGQNDYLSWILRGVQVSYPYSYIAPSQVPFTTRGEKPWRISWPYDFDSVVPSDLDHFRFVLASRSPYASNPPPNWRRVRVTRSYQVFERDGPTPPRSVAAEAGAAGAVLQCGSPAGTGTAGIPPRTVVIDNSQLRSADGGTLGDGEFHFRQIEAGGTAVATARLPAGAWTVSLQYVSPVALEVTAGSKKLTVPASQEGPGVFWRVGTFTSDGGSQRIVIRPGKTAPLETFRDVLLGSVALTAADTPERIVSLRRACGRYVDWYAASAT